jgi:hypothetical protein
MPVTPNPSINEVALCKVVIDVKINRDSAISTNLPVIPPRNIPTLQPNAIVRMLEKLILGSVELMASAVIVPPTIAGMNQ